MLRPRGRSLCGTHASGHLPGHPSHRQARLSAF
jgi:hypothetical protein